jgi:hypothetical protein
MLFDKKKRTRTAPKKPGESEYQFYDSSARPEFQVYRNLVNGWIAELPGSERAETINRFRKSDNLGYQAVLAELAVHAALIPGKRKAAAAAGASMPAQPNPVAGTPLRIPYGNKEVALKLGARYGSVGWYAPPGVETGPFEERGWV